jgi:streptomycin 6-kinase
MPVDLTQTRATALRVADEWGVELGERFEFAFHSYVAPVGEDAVLKVAWEGDDESLHEIQALELWGGDGAVRVLRSDPSRRAMLLQRARPGTDLSELPDDEATAIALDIARRLWRPGCPPFRPVAPEIEPWLDEAEREDGSELVPLARELYARVGCGTDWVVHGDLHHHNILRHDGAYAAIDPKPYLADREYDVVAFLWNPWDFEPDRERFERRLAAFVAAGLDGQRIREWMVIRGAYLRPEWAGWLRTLLEV